MASRKSNRLPLRVVWYWVLKRPARVFSCERSLRSDVSRTSEAVLDFSSTCTAATMIEVLRSLGRKCFNHKEMQSIHQIRAGNRSGEYRPGENASAPPCAEASAQPFPHNPRKQRKNPAAAGSGERVREGKWRRERDCGRTFSNLSHWFSTKIKNPATHRQIARAQISFSSPSSPQTSG